MRFGFTALAGKGGRTDSEFPAGGSPSNRSSQELHSHLAALDFQAVSVEEQCGHFMEIFYEICLQNNQQLCELGPYHIFLYRRKDFRRE